MTTQTRSISQDVTNQMRDTTVMIKRNLLRIIRLPQLLFFSSVQPIIFLLLFTFVFGGAITRGTDISYIDFLLPGVLVQTAVFGSTQTAIGLTEDLAAGVIDRFRSLPMARSAVLAGRTTADLVRNAAVTVIMLTVGTIIGYRIGGTVIEAAVGVAIALLFGFSVSWAMAALGLWVKNAETAHPRVRKLDIRAPCVYAQLAARIRGQPTGLCNSEHRSRPDGGPTSRLADPRIGDVDSGNTRRLLPSRCVSLPKSRQHLTTSLDRSCEHSCEWHRAASDPLVVFEVSPHADSDDRHRRKNQGVGPPPRKRRHVLEVHAENASEQCQW